MDIDNKGVNQLLLSPLFLFDQILSIVAPGALFLFLLALKQNTTLRNIWYGAPLGYKTKIAAFVFLSYVVGNLVRLPINILLSFFKLRKKDDTSTLPNSWKNQPVVIRKILTGIFLDGALLATPGLIDRLSLAKAEGGFYLGTGAALLLASLVPGDGFRGYEALIGLAMLWVARFKAHSYSDLTLGTVGVGLANIFARMNPQQIQMAAAVLKSLKLEGLPEEMPTPETAAPKAESQPESGLPAQSPNPAR